MYKWAKATENYTMTKRPREANGRDENEKKTEQLLKRNGKD